MRQFRRPLRHQRRLPLAAERDERQHVRARRLRPADFSPRVVEQLSVSCFAPDQFGRGVADDAADVGAEVRRARRAGSRRRAGTVPPCRRRSSRGGSSAEPPRDGRAGALLASSSSGCSSGRGGIADVSRLREEDVHRLVQPARDVELHLRVGAARYVGGPLVRLGPEAEADDVDRPRRRRASCA